MFVSPLCLAALKDVMKMIATRKNIRLEDNEASSSAEAPKASGSGAGKSTRRALGKPSTLSHRDREYWVG
jgi:hypothetical protein